MSRSRCGVKRMIGHVEGRDRTPLYLICMQDAPRSIKPITMMDLRRLGDIALRDLKTFFRHHPRRHIATKTDCSLWRSAREPPCTSWTARMESRTSTSGVFLELDPAKPFPYRRHATADFGSPKFGKSPNWEHFVGRRVDLLGRSLKVSSQTSPADVLRAYLSSSVKTASARALSEKAMILVYPHALLGSVVWPP